jgi:protein gp37
MASRFAGNGEVFEGLTVGKRWTGLTKLYPHELIKPIWWTKPARIGVSFMGDMFNDGADWRDQAAVFGAMLMAPQHKFFLLTKQPARIQQFADCLSHPSLKSWCDDQLIDPDLLPAQLCVEIAKRKTAEPAFDHRKLTSLAFPPENVWTGTSVENQRTADYRINHLRQLRGFNGRLWLSVEPMLERIILKEWLPFLDFVVVGGESGPGHRPMRLSWARRLRYECAEAEVPFFFKQTAGKKEIPDDLMIRQFPAELDLGKAQAALW